MGEPELGSGDLPLPHAGRGVSRIRRVGSAGLAAGTTIGGFRIDALIGVADTGAVYEATQLSLHRKVALRLIAADHFASGDDRERFDREQRLAASLHHPALVGIYEFGEWKEGRFVAMRLIRGRTLADLREREAPVDQTMLAPVADALAAAHEAGLAHGRVVDRNVFVDAAGAVHLADLGLGRAGSAAGDARDLAAMMARAGPADSASQRGPRRVRLVLAAVAAVAAGALAIALAGGADQPAPARAPAAPAGTEVAGSALPAVATRPLGCSADPSANTPACTVTQLTAKGGGSTIPSDGVIRSWAVRGASGQLALQVIRTRGKRSLAVAFSQPELIATGEAPRLIPADIGVRAGDRIGLQLGPGATVGVSTATPRAKIARWDGGLTASPQLVDTVQAGAELMLRADVEFGARANGLQQLTGAQAARAPAGRELDTLDVGLGAGRDARVVVVALEGEIAIDLFAGGRLARLAVPDAAPEGELLSLTQACGRLGSSGFCLRWRNPGAQLPLQHAYVVSPEGLLRLIG